MLLLSGFPVLGKISQIKPRESASAIGPLTSCIKMEQSPD
jgi:hypothetical protein